MTLRSLINFGQARQRFAGVDVRIANGNILDMSFVVLETKNDVLTIIKQGSGICSLADLKAEMLSVLPAKGRIHLNLRGRDILSKASEKKPEGDLQQAARLQFPMIKADDFFIQRYSASIVDYFSILRRDTMDIFTELAEYYTIAGISLGMYVVGALLAVLNASRVVLPDAVITISGNKIGTIEECTEDVSLSSVMIGNDRIPADMLLAYASAWNVVLEDSNLQCSALSWVAGSKSQFNILEKVYKYARVALMAVFVTMLINSSVYFWLKDRTTEMSLHNSFLSDRLSVSQAHEKKLATLQAAHKSIGWESNELPLYYADQLAKILPREIQLTELEIGVLDRDVLRKEKREFFQPSMIHVEGSTNSPVVVQEWVRRIEGLAWVKELSDQKYNHDARQLRGTFEFYIEVR